MLSADAGASSMPSAINAAGEPSSGSISPEDLVSSAVAVEKELCGNLDNVPQPSRTVRGRGRGRGGRSGRGCSPANASLLDEAAQVGGSGLKELCGNLMKLPKSRSRHPKALKAPGLLLTPSKLPMPKTKSSHITGKAGGDTVLAKTKREAKPCGRKASAQAPCEQDGASGKTDGAPLAGAPLVRAPVMRRPAASDKASATKVLMKACAPINVVAPDSSSTSCPRSASPASRTSRPSG